MRIAWSDFKIDTDSRTLEQDGVPVRMQALAFDLLALLASHRGRVVSDAQLRRTLWPDVTVSAASLRQVVKEARRAIGDDGHTQSAIQTVRGRGLRFVAEIADQGGTVSAPFVGRHDVLEALERELDDTESGRGGMTLLVGRAGIGKSSTSSEIAARAVARGWRVIEATAHAGAESDAYALWVPVAAELGVPDPNDGPAGSPASRGVSASSRIAQFRSYAEALAESARHAPTLLVFDDLHDADRESLALLRFVAPALRGLRARVLGGHRPLAPDDARTLDLRALAADSATRVIELAALGTDDARALVAARLGLRLSPEAGEALVAQTGGSPLLMLEVARALHARGIALEVASAEEIAESVALGVVPLVRRRLAALAPPTRRALHAAAALGDPSELALVAAASDLAPAQVERARLEAERASLIERQGDSTWRFAHPLFAEAVADDLAAQGGETATTVHLRVFEALDAQGDRDPYRVASHALRVRDRLGSATLVDRLRRAAQSAWRVYAVEEARTWQQRAVEVAEAAGHPPLERCDLLLELGELTIASGGVNAARACFDRAARFAREQRDAARLARAALGYAHRALVLDAQEQVIEWLRVAHAAPSGDPALEARVAARLGAEQVAANTGDRDAAERLLRDGVERARRTCDALGVAQVLADQSITRFSAADPHAALVLAREVEHCGRHAEDAEIEFRGLAEIATLQAELGDRAGVDEAVAACAAFAVRVPIPFARGVTHGMTAMVALLDGRLDAAREAMGAADRYGRATGGLGFGVVAVLQRFLLAREQQALADLVPELDGVKARFPALPGIGVLSGLAHALCGNAVPARAASERLLASLGTLPFDRTRLATLAAGAELAHRTNSVALARALDPLLAPFASLHAVVGNAACYLGSIEHALGLVAAADGRVGQARDRFARARHAHAAMGSGPWAARSAQYAAELTA